MKNLQRRLRSCERNWVLPPCHTLLDFFKKTWLPYVSHFEDFVFSLFSLKKLFA